MKKLFDGIWIYCLCLGFFVLLGIFFAFIHANPSRSLDQLTKTKSIFAKTVDSPCQNALNGEPSIAVGDYYLKVNIYCPDGSYSTNILRYSAIPETHTMDDVLSIITQVNGFDIQYDADHKVTAIGNVKNTNKRAWKIRINSAPVVTGLKDSHLIPNNLVEINYEQI